jgi:hypothetical protein
MNHNHHSGKSVALGTAPGSQAWSDFLATEDPRELLRHTRAAQRDTIVYHLRNSGENEVLATFLVLENMAHAIEQAMAAQEGGAHA